MIWIQLLGLATYRFGQRKNSTREVEEKNSQEACEIQFAAYKQFYNDITVGKKHLIKCRLPGSCFDGEVDTPE